MKSAVPSALVLLLSACLWPSSAFPQSASSSTLSLQEIRLSTTGEQKTISLLFSQPPTAVHAFALSSPSRLVIDVGGPFKALPPATYPAEDSLLSRVRTGSHQQLLRFVMDFKAASVPPFVVEQTGAVVTAVLTVQGTAAGEAHTQLLFPPAKKTIAAREVPKTLVAPPPQEPVVLPSRGEARRHLERGQVLYDGGKLHEAITEWREAVRLAPDMAEAHHLLGLALQDRGDLAEAIVEFREALRLSPDDAMAYVHLARALENQGDVKEALVTYRKALQFVPTSAPVYNRIAHLLATQGDWEGAVREWRQTTQLRPDYAYAYANLGEALEHTGKPRDALIAYERAVQLDPHAPFVAEVRQRIARLRASQP